LLAFCGSANLPLCKASFDYTNYQGESALLLRGSIFLVAVIMVASIFAGCGGGGQERESATGVVKSAGVDKRRLKVKPQGEDAKVFKYNPENVKVELNGEEASPAEIEEGQRAEIEYVVREDRNVARSISLMPGGENPPEGGGTTG
jgi:hypothetical protein